MRLVSGGRRNSAAAQDGKDVSWIWDVDFERLCEMGDTLREIYVSGVRADDMALRRRGNCVRSPDDA